nr:MAG TPA: hypothetical protein [Caudoviricetes sp.]
MDSITIKIKNFLTEAPPFLSKYRRCGRPMGGLNLSSLRLCTFFWKGGRNG